MVLTFDSVELFLQAFQEMGKISHLTVLNLHLPKTYKGFIEIGELLQLVTVVSTLTF